MVVTATAYCPCAKCCGSNADGKTATGSNAYTKGVAVDPAVSPLGTRFDIPGVGSWLPADDTGSAIKGHRIDVRFTNHESAKLFGTQRIKVRVWE